ncbi:energy-coupling factor transporter transmembrane component T family protein [Corynebacterium poyangense]|uniref:energy-coupling factor transporter transmembrane component T family protein n=1 Tax=Corynebacterium poyangense TaxID=2684405 RepID=UPI00165CF728|nr:energy-coupling factor transporter transmembrane protein EcfT [Corynebacterium poyangense]
MNNPPLGVYFPGNSIIHRLTPGPKFLGLIIYILVVTFAISQLRWALVAATIPLAGFIIAKIPLRLALQQLWPPVPLLLTLGAFRWWSSDMFSAALMVTVLFLSIMAAALVTLTTPLTQLMDSLDHTGAPLARLGVPVEAISLAITLTIRLIPVLFLMMSEVLDARKARGAGWSLTAFGVPLMVRCMKKARALGEALQARGVDEDDF